MKAKALSFTFLKNCDPLQLGNIPMSNSLLSLPAAAGESIRSLDATPTSPPAQEMKEDADLALKHHMQARESYEAREGIAAFNENRKTNWAKLLAHVLERQDR